MSEEGKVTEDQETGPEPVILEGAKAGTVTAEVVEVRQSSVDRVEAETADIGQSWVNSVDADEVRIMQGGIFTAEAALIEVSQGGIVVAQGQSVSLNQGGIGAVIAERARVQDAFVGLVGCQGGEWRGQDPVRRPGCGRVWPGGRGRDGTSERALGTPEIALSDALRQGRS